MRKRILNCLLCVILLISAFPVSAQAEEITYYQILIDAGDGVQTEKAIIEDDEIYIAATSFSKYTRFEFDEATQTFLVKGQEADKAFKKVIVNAETKKAAVGTKLIELENSFVVDGVAYLPFCQMLPILNADIIEVDSGVIYVVNNKLSMAELLYDFDINDYRFNISEEFFGRTDLLYWYIAPSYLFDTVVNFRFDRLDIVFESGSCEDYQTILTDYLKDDELFHKAMSEEDFVGDLLESITELTGISEKLNDIYDWFDEIEEIDYDPLKSDKLVRFIQKTHSSEAFDDELHTWVEAIHGDIVKDVDVSVADIFEGIDFLYTYLTQVEDHQKMLDAVYGIVDRQKKLESISGATTSFVSVDPEYLAAEQIYELYTGNIIPAVTKKTVEEIAEKLLEDFAAVKTLGIYSLTAGLAGEILELYLPGDSGDRALLLQHSNIANSAMRKAVVPTLDTEKSTDEYRLSLLLTLLASRACYEIMAETVAGYSQDDGYYQSQIEKIEKRIMGLYLVAHNVAFDTYENYEVFAGQNRNTIKDSNLLGNTTVYPDMAEADYLVFLNEHLEYNYYALLDINGDGVLEMLATEQVSNANTVSFYPVDLFVWKAGEVLLVDHYLKPNILSYDISNHWILYEVSHGTGLLDKQYSYIDKNLEVKSDWIEYEWFQGVESVKFNGADITSENREVYEGLLQKEKSGTPMEIVFHPIKKNDKQYSIHNLKNEIIDTYGVVSKGEFTSCIGSDISDYSEKVNGYINDVSVDLDFDDTHERLVFIGDGKSNQVKMQVYCENSDKYVLSYELPICSLSYCSQQNISIFYNEKDKEYILLVDAKDSGAYTGNNVKSAKIYKIGSKQILKYSVSSWDSDSDNIKSELEKFGVPYAVNCTEIDNITSNVQYKELFEIRHRYFNGDPLGGYWGREHHLQFVSNGIGNLNNDEIQTWTITKRSYQTFTEYKEITYTEEWKTGIVHTVVPKWDVNDDESYLIMSFEVDMENRTIDIFMDSPEGSQCWESLVIDLKENTYYGVGYFSS